MIRRTDAGALSLARDRTFANDLARIRDRALAGADDRTLADDLAVIGTDVLAVAEALAHDRVATTDYALVRDLRRTQNISRAFTRVRPGELALCHDLIRELARALTLALTRAGALDRDQTTSGARKETAGSARSMPGRVPLGLLTLAVQLLPRSQRPRYRQEFRVELVDLPRRERWRYALRVLIRAWELRRVLAGAICTPDGAPLRQVER